MAHIDWGTIGITDHYMFGTVFRDPELCKELLEIVLSISIERIVFVDSERTLSPEIGAKGIRMDVYVADESGAVYDVELQNANQGSLEKRSRFYLSSNDMDCIAPGILYEDMRDSYVLFVCSFDPFGRGLATYTVTPHCREDGAEMPDGSTRVFVNSLAWSKCDDERLGHFLKYLCGDTMVEDEFIRKIDAAVQRIRQQPEWRRNRMKLERYLEEQRALAIKQGREQGLEQGREQGLEQGREQGLEQGLEQGRQDERRLNAQLAEVLARLGRQDELMGAMVDSAMRDKLLEELGIE